MTFRNDQWYNLYSRTNSDGSGENLRPTVSNKSGYAVYGADNDDFMYPTRRIRTFNPDDPNGGHGTLNLKRGYIRSLTTEDNSMGLPSRKCAFQFNPQYLVQSVSQNTTILNFLQQDPAQYAQPIPGNVSFTFELFFDRSMEMNNWKPTDSFDPSSPWEKSDPSVIGVLHDIATFYSVIGVGLSDAMGEYAKKVLDRQITNTINSEALKQADNEESTYDTDAEYQKATSAASDFLSYNAGNTAFLLPLPVRIVFSSLYIVEGLVNDVTVTFTKFNAAMVPMQCTLNVMFEAKYIGFAKKDTFFTKVLLDYENVELAEGYTGEASPEELADYYSAIISDFSTASVYPRAEVDSVFAKLTSEEKEDATDTEIEERTFQLHLDFPRSGNSATSGLISLANVNKNISVTVSSVYEMWRYTDTFKNANSGLFSELGRSTSSYSTLTSGITSTTLQPSATSSSAYEPEVKEVCRKIFKELRGWNSKSGVVIVDSDIDEPTGGKAAFKNVQRILTLRLNDDSVDADEGYQSTFSGSAELTKLVEDGTRAVRQQPISNGGNFDRSTAQPGIDGNKYPESNRPAYSSPFYYAVECKVTLTIEIDDFSVTNTAVDYILLPDKGVGDAILNKISAKKNLNFSWEYELPEESNNNGSNGPTLDTGQAQTNALTFTDGFVGVF